MTCASCSAHVEKAVNAVDGVTSCAVSLLTNSMGVEGTASPQAIIAAVERAGYGAKLKQRGIGGTESSGQGSADTEGNASNIGNAGGVSDMDAELEALADHETPALCRRLIASIVFLLLLMYVSMGHMMWGWPLPQVLAENHLAMALLEMLLTIIVMVINQRFFINGFRSLWHLSPNMDALVALGSSAAFVYSTCVLFRMTAEQMRGDMDAVMSSMHGLYFESAAMILTLITVGKMLEAYSKGRTTDALKSLMRLAPKTATVVRNRQEVVVPVEQVRKGDIFVVRPGESLPVDGIVIEGTSAVNEASLTGESIPVDKAAGDAVSAATVNQSGFLRCEATRVGEDTTLSQIIRMVSDAAATKAPIAKIADRVSAVFVPAVIALALITIVVWLVVGQTVGFALARGICVLVISCPCALGLATPVAIMVGNGMGARGGILFKTAASLEETGRIQIVALDKTGTITKGEPKVTDLVPADGVTMNELLTMAAALEAGSEHPLARAIMEYATEQGISYPQVQNFQALPGHGLQAELAESDAAQKTSGKDNQHEIIRGGSSSYIKSIMDIPQELATQTDAFAKEGKTPLFFAKGDHLLGVIAVADVIKEDSTEAIAQLRGMGIRVVMLTGDNAQTAAAIGKQAGVDEVAAGVLPDGKEAAIRQMQQHGKVAMVGDGINDAPALTRADVGIAIGAGTDVAIDAADVVLVKNSLMDVCAAVRLGRYTLRDIHQNLFWAFFYNVICIPLAAGVWIPLFHWQLNPMIGAAAMSLSSFCVVMNALRLNLYHIHDVRHDRPMKHAVQGKILADMAEGQQESMKYENGCCENMDGVNHPQQKQENGCILKDKNKIDERLENNNSFYEGLLNDNNMQEKKEDSIMTKTITIDGMMCTNCEKHVRKALEALPQVDSAEVSHEAGTAVVTLNAEVDDAVLAKAVEEEDYKVVSIA